MTILSLSVLSVSEQQLAALVNYIGWSYVVVWSLPQRALVWQLWPAGSSFQQTLFYTAYKSCQFPFGHGHAGIAVIRREHVWVTGVDVTNTSVFEQRDFLQATIIQSLLCIPLLDGVLEIGSTDTILEIDSLLQTIRTFLYAAPVSLPVPTEHPSTSTSSIFSQSPSEASLDIPGLHHQSYMTSDWTTIYQATSSLGTLVAGEQSDSSSASAFRKWDPLQQKSMAIPTTLQAMIKRVLRALAQIEETPSETEDGDSISRLRSLIPFKTKDKLSVLQGGWNVCSAREARSRHPGILQHGSGQSDEEGDQEEHIFEKAMELMAEILCLRSEIWGRLTAKSKMLGGRKNYLQYLQRSNH
ncbi:hypothetical protein SELMODRAFT_411162 [Selaginella moellendorffii]|uniref:Transcription factor MYC/MYB N-terminal domain-containing protein n=1 Tax=Selaginella moellendorffii TaxID=88036 RepID=D8RGR9_SELML|nr:hypothetical protein SELMODRAFT_411162 [Selaginella moellendorffii]